MNGGHLRPTANKLQFIVNCQKLDRKKLGVAVQLLLIRIMLVSSSRYSQFKQNLKI